MASKAMEIDLDPTTLQVSDGWSSLEEQSQVFAVKGAGIWDGIW